ncbi:MAG TPA: tryptophan--tRNA ligase, partial [Promineifilum sp.]|nr:tryptophan--tRNA ligase [Promineifilum sp.]
MRRSCTSEYTVDAAIEHEADAIGLSALLVSTSKQMPIAVQELHQRGLDYPVLMAGDILFYDADEVPVGEDQKQHVELTRDIAQRFNALYEQEFFVIPQPVIPEVGARVMGLDDPTVKMSKSLADKRGHAVRMLDTPDEILYSFKRAVTDSGREIAFSNAPEKAGVNNLLGIYRAITGKSNAEVEADFAHARGYGDLKVRVAEVVIETLRPIQARHRALMDDTAELDRILAHGAEQARAIAQPKVDAMKQIMGLVLPGKVAAG